jgi:uncharacterized protein DUF2721
VLPSTPSITRLSTVIAQATAPAFLLGAPSGFIAILIARLNRIIDRPVSSEARLDELAGAKLKDDMRRLKARASLINRAIMWTVASSVATALLLIVAFGIALFRLPHEYGVAILFVVALGTFTASVINLAREVHIAVMDFEHFG